MPRSLARSIALAFVCATVGLVAATSRAIAAPAFYSGISADGSIAVFSTKDQMVPGDTDQEVDVYVRSLDSTLSEYVTRQVSLGPTGGNDTLPSVYNGISSDGDEVFFSTTEGMVPGDTDQSQDVYVRNLDENRTLLASAGNSSCAIQGCGNEEINASYVPDGAVADGGGVFFATSEPLVDADQDSSLDIYLRDVEAETTVLVSVGQVNGNGAFGAVFRGADEAGELAFFTTSESLVTEDVDTATDIYARDVSAETTSLVSIQGTCPDPLPPGLNCEPTFGAASSDGSHVFFETVERLSGADTDSSQDVYEWSGGAPALASIGPDGGNGESVVTYAGSSGDGSIVYFQTSERLDTTADTDSAQDVYQRSGGETTLASAGEGGKGNENVLASFSGASSTGGVAFFRTAEALTAADTDSAQDVYQRSGGVTTLVSIGPAGGSGNADASFAGASADGSKVFFVTVESLVPADTDASLDVYRRSGSETVLVSTGQINGNGAFTVGLHGVSANGEKAFFTTQERLTEGDDFSGEQDVYSWTAPANVLLVSVKNSPDLVLGPPPPTLEKTVPASPDPSTTPTIVGKAADGALVKIYRTFDCSGEPVAQGTAEELTSPGLTVTPVAVGSTTNFRATAEAEGVVSVCSSAIAYKQEDAPPPPPPPPGEEGTGGSGGTGSTGGSTGPGGKTSGGGTTRGGITYVTPLPRITFAPAGKTRLRRPTFRFTDATEQPGTRFFCRVDKRKWASCTSPIKLRKLKLGRHVFSLKAVNAVGTAGASPVKRAFRVVR